MFGAATAHVGKGRKSKQISHPVSCGGAENMARKSLEARKPVKQTAKMALSRLAMSSNLGSYRSNAQDYTCEV
jgi:hypothetical protein